MSGASGVSDVRGIDWRSSDGVLILNPRLDEGARRLYRRAWHDHMARISNETPMNDSTGNKRSTEKPDGRIGIVTSGTSGEMGRLIVLAKVALLASAQGVNDHLQVTVLDRWMKALPDFHVGGLGIHVRAYLSGATVVESPLERWEAFAFHRALTAADATLVSLVPTQLFDLVQRRLRAPRSLRAALIGGSRLEVALYRQAIDLGWPLIPSYGLTECSSTVAAARLGTPVGEPGDEPRLFPLPHVELRVRSDSRLEIRSAALLTAQIRFVNGESCDEDPKQEEGWLVIDDRVRLRDDGSLEVIGRSQDFVKVGGEGVVLSRLEERLEALKLSRNWHDVLPQQQQQQQKFDAAVLGAADPRLGAIIVLITDAATAEAVEEVRLLVDEFNRLVMPFERIRGIHCVSRLPRTELGKLLRREALALAGLEPVADL